MKSELVQWYLLFDSGQARVDKHSCGADADADPSRHSRAGVRAPPFERVQQRRDGAGAP